ncbi:bifunctional glycosyltransferase/class I SAM-dependent methyltransferase [Candidatus Pelagibacter sp.]|nr:bifunctional glycosyltransferase/class I SAM-dependent methyltransferase [Candidatus Pelagibacter sp.]
MKKKLLIYIVAFNHEKFIEKVLDKIDDKIFEKYQTEILVNDDSSQDETLKIINDYKNQNIDKNCKITILSNPDNLGYGGNQKIGYYYAIKNQYDFVALVHGDGQYAPELLDNLIEDMSQKNADAVFGSRMLIKGGALKGGMPLYKFIGNKILTFFQNKILSSNLSEFHSGYRIYTVDILKKIPFHLNSNDYSFDTEIIIQLLFSKSKIAEFPIPTYYGEEISYVNGLYYAYRIMIESFKAKVLNFGILYDKKYDVLPIVNNYLLKDNFLSPHSEAINQIKNKSKVLDIGCNDGGLGNKLMSQKECEVIGLEVSKNQLTHNLNEFYMCDLDKGLPDINYDSINYITMLDVIEHLKNPEEFMDQLYSKVSNNDKIEILISTPNISFIVIRLMLFFGFFNYGKRGILDKTHTRLFTFSSFSKLILGANFKIVDVKGMPAPFPLAIGSNIFSNLLININKSLIFLFKSLFSYQIFMKIRPRASLELLLSRAKEKAKLQEK